MFNAAQDAPASLFDKPWLGIFRLNGLHMD